MANGVYCLATSFLDLLILSPLYISKLFLVESPFIDFR